ncbi:MAG: hypothetical protein AB7T49_06770 [Oligoflexales bacterium]
MTNASELSRVLGVLNKDLKSAEDFVAGSAIVALQRDTAALARHIHDLRGCARSVKILIQMIEDGEQFDSGDNKTLLSQVKQSTQALQPTIDFLKEIHDAE